ncbi:phosphatase PAP2 family protein [Dyadobacter sp.]|uniref:phosphatase PAP2 family protein n=1 Tax=Dyadobacter sp. TaxID=1914288 RepID=UPI003F70DCE3
MIFKAARIQILTLLICCNLLPQTVVAQRDSTLWRVKAGDIIPPISLAVAGMVVQGKVSRSLQREVRSQYPGFHTNADDFLPYLPGVVSLGLASAGVKGKHSLGDQVVLALLSNVGAQVVTQGLKRAVRYPRPNGEDNHSFPSGHTTTAFANAEILHQEYGDRSVFYSIGGYGTAATVGTMRILNNKHWLADVLMGAGIGIGATKVFYISYPWLKQKVSRTKKTAPVY